MIAVRLSVLSLSDKARFPCVRKYTASTSVYARLQKSNRKITLKTPRFEIYCQPHHIFMQIALMVILNEITKGAGRSTVRACDRS